MIFFRSYFICLVTLINFSFAINECPSNPGLWCTNIETAKNCDVLDQCYNFVWQQKNEVVSNDLVNLTLYYETLCPDCREFISEQVWSAFYSVLPIMNLTLVPYGNAKEIFRNETQLWQFTCQHGADECWGNLYHSCLINFYPRVEDHFQVIHCMESDASDDIRKSATKCSAEFKIQTNLIEKCMSSKLGNDLQHKNAVLTEILNPPHKYVPWITLNGVHTEKIQELAQADLVGLVCKTYEGDDKPQACM